MSSAYAGAFRGWRRTIDRNEELRCQYHSKIRELADSDSQYDRIRLSAQAQVGWPQHVVSGPPQQPSQKRRSDVLVQVKPH